MLYVNVNFYLWELMFLVLWNLEFSWKPKVSEETTPVLSLIVEVGWYQVLKSLMFLFLIKKMLTNFHYCEN